MQKHFFCIVLFFFGVKSFSQINVKDSILFAPIIIPSAGFHFPVGTLADRYGLNYQVGGSFLIKNKTNWIFGASGNFIFGENVNQQGLLNPVLPIIDGDGQLPAIELGMRGFSVMANAGKIFPIASKPNRNSGILLLLGAGFIQHQIYISARGGLTPQLDAEYLKGYDRLSNGFALSQFIGYMFFGNNRTVNFYAGFEAIQGFTQNRRGYNYDTFQPDNANNVDVFLGMKIGWMFPIYKKSSKQEKEFFYY
jgi:hypothetical protein